MAVNRVFAPNRGHPITEGGQTATHELQVFLEEIERVIKDDVDNYTALDIRVTALEPTYTSITSADSPYAASDMEYILCDMDGNISITIPSSGRVWVSRKGASNTLTLTGTINGVVNPTVAFDGTALAMAYISTEWRYV